MKEVDEPSANSRTEHLFSSYGVCALAITTVIGGQYYEWNKYLSDGFGFFIVAQVLMALAYVIYVFTMAEIVSAFPFSGGGFGLARVAQGYYVGFLIGCTSLTVHFRFCMYRSRYACY